MAWWPGGLILIPLVLVWEGGGGPRLVRGQEKSHAIERYSKIAGNQSITTQTYLGFFKSMAGVRSTLCLFCPFKKKVNLSNWAGHLYLSRPHKLWVWPHCGCSGGVAYFLLGAADGVTAVEQTLLIK